ncbi:MAG: hypothetical protein ACI9DJ_002025 [Algoriphagus sp.]|jgi:hypothetical protein
MRLKNWIDETRELKIKLFNSVTNSIENRFETTLQLFHQRGTTANTESFKRVISSHRSKSNCSEST